jgi:hypothetical protein
VGGFSATRARKSTNWFKGGHSQRAKHLIAPLGSLKSVVLLGLDSNIRLNILEPADTATTTTGVEWPVNGRILTSFFEFLQIRQAGAKEIAFGGRLLKQPLGRTGGREKGG